MSLLSAGLSFSGVQKVANKESWDVSVHIHYVNEEKGYLCGIMEARNVPDEAAPVVTFWEGEIIDSTPQFWTNQWNATRKTDLVHWRRFSAFLALCHGSGEAPPDELTGLRHQQHIFMRWKERLFLNATTGQQVTIAGFYYLCFNRATGNIDGYYFDPLSSPFQKLKLKPTSSTANGLGQTFPAFAFR